MQEVVESEFRSSRRNDILSFRPEVERLLLDMTKAAANILS